MGSSGGSAKPSFTFNDKQALALNQQNTKQLQQYQLQRQGLLGNQNAATANYFNNTNTLAQDQLLQNMGFYTNALSGYQNSLNQNTADANSMLNAQNQYYNQVLGGQQQYQNQFANLMGDVDAQAAASNAQYQQNYLANMGQYNQDNTAQQQAFMQNYLGQIADYNGENNRLQDKYQSQYQNTKGLFAGLKQNTSANQAALNQQGQNQSLIQLLQQWGGGLTQASNVRDLALRNMLTQLRPATGAGNRPASSANGQFPNSRY